MKEIVISLVLMVVIAVGAAFTLGAMDWSAKRVFTTERGNVRL